MKTESKKKFFFIFLISSALSLFSLEVPRLTGPVVDNAGIFKKSDFNSLTSHLLSLNSQNGPQIAVLILKSLEGESIESFSIKVAEKWKIGSSENDDGVIILISLDEHKIRIEVGYGLEGTLTDAKCSLIIRNIMAPLFRSDKYAKGITEAVYAIEGVLGINGMEEPEELSQNNGEILPSFYIIVCIFAFIYFFIFTGALSLKFPWLAWLPWARFFKSTKPSHFHDDHFSGFSGGGFGGFGGGGFSGRGGGFGGGGASGGW